jgi:hypothetical protein
MTKAVQVMANERHGIKRSAARQALIENYA